MSPTAKADLVNGVKELSGDVNGCADAFKTVAALIPDTEFSVGSIKLDGDFATVDNPSASSDADRTTNLVRLDGKWLIAGDNEANGDAGGVDRAQVKQWPKQWCKAKPGMTRAQLEELMGPATSGVTQDEAAKSGGNPSMSWDYAEYQFNAFFNVDDKVRQLDVNEIDLSSSQKRAIKCETTRR